MLTGPVKFRFEQTLEPDGDGTRVSMMVEGEQCGFFKLGEPLVERALNWTLPRRTHTVLALGVGPLLG